MIPVVGQADVLQLDIAAILYIAVTYQEITLVARRSLRPLGIFVVVGCPTGIIGIHSNITDVTQLYILQVTIEDIVTMRTLKHEAERQILPCQVVGQAPCIVWVGITDDGTVCLGNLAIMIEVKVTDFTNLRLHGCCTCKGILRIGTYGCFIVIESILYIAIDGTDRATIALYKHVICTIPQGVGILVTIQAANLILVECQVRIDVPMPAVAVNRSDAQCQLKTLVGYITRVGQLVRETCRRRNLHLLQQVAGLLVIIVGSEGQAVVKQSEVNTEVILSSGLPLDI